MSPTDLLLLGLLRRQPRSAYELNSHVDVIRVSKWLRLRSSTMYANVKRLAAGGFLSATKVRSGELPERTIYTVTAAGEEYFAQLMRHFADHPGSLALDFTAMVANLHMLDASTAADLLDRLRDAFCRANDDLAADTAALLSVPPGGQAVLRLYQMLLATLIQWVDEQRSAEAKGAVP